MIRPVKIVFANLFLLACCVSAQAQTIDIRTKDVQLTLVVGQDNKVYQAYFGQSLSESGKNVFTQKRHEAYIAWGTYDLFEPALRVTHPDGNPALVPHYVSHKSTKDANGNVLTEIVMRDSVYPVTVTLFYMAYPNENVIRAWTEIQHTQKNPIVLSNFASNMLHFDANQYWLTQFHGDWAAEMKQVESRLTSGIKKIDSKLGQRTAMFQTPVFMLSPEHLATETTGDVLVGTLEWSGNFQFVFELDNQNSLRIISGMNPFASEYHLPANQKFTTPAFIFTYSTDGKGKASRDMHRWARKYGVLDGTKPRMTLLNNWEATFFKFDETKLKELIGDAATLGVDLFLLDDGWFGHKYPRDSDKFVGLGDWQVDRRKLPNGLRPLIEEAKAKGVKFGIWIEPENVSPQSELFEKHPDWVVRLPNRALHFYRQQLVLDVANPKVQDFIFNMVDNLMTEHPEIAYIKWDANRMMTNTFSPFLKNRQSHFFIEYQRGLYSVLERLRKKYPHLPIMLCSGGGGRVDYGSLKYFQEFWPSDNTDPLERIYMQWGYSYFFPATVISAHVTSWGKQSIKFRTDVAMSGRFGFDIDISTLNEQELQFCQKAVENYKRLADVILQGDLYRLVSPYEDNRAVLMYVSDNKEKAVLFSYTTYPRSGDRFMPVRLQGLDPKKTYDVKEINTFGNARSVEFLAISGEQLLNEGIRVTSGVPLTSRVFEIRVRN